MRGGGVSVTTVEVRAEKGGPEREGGGECFQGVCMFSVFGICGCFSSSFPRYFNKVEVLKAAAPPSGAVPPETFWCILHVHPGLTSVQGGHACAPDRAGCKHERPLFELSIDCRSPTSAVPSMKGGLVAGRHTSWTL